MSQAGAHLDMITGEDIKFQRRRLENKHHRRTHVEERHLLSTTTGESLLAKCLHIILLKTQILIWLVMR